VKAKAGFALLFLALLVIALILLRLRLESASRISQPESQVAAATENQPAATSPIQSSNQAQSPRLVAPLPAQTSVPQPTLEATNSTNKLQRLEQIRQMFRTLAAGDPKLAMAAAKKLTDEVEREAALMTLVSEWTHGELGSPINRARAIAFHGLEAGIGMELAKYPDLAVAWANELTEGANRTALLREVAVGMAGTDVAAAFALSQQLPPQEQQSFINSVIAGWAEKDTASALQWADQLTDPDEHNKALQVIRSVAPVGIGAMVSMQEGYPVVNQLVPDSPAALSGQLHRGDRIVALAQGDYAFVDARSLALKDVVEMIRGAPGSLLQLQVLSADAPPNSPPRTISIVRDQLKYKR
jgi:hypothetical protein